MLDLGSETQIECMLSESFPCKQSKQRTMKLDCYIIQFTRVPVKRKMFYTFACNYMYNYNNSDCEAHVELVITVNSCPLQQANKLPASK